MRIATDGTTPHDEDLMSCGLCGKPLTDADTCEGACPYKPMTMPERLDHRVSSAWIAGQIAAERAQHELDRVDPFVRPVLAEFEEAYEKASLTSKAEDWHEAALLGKQLANAVRRAS